LPSASDKGEVFWQPEVFKVAKIITRVWEENQGVARPQRHLGGSDSRWRQQASTIKTKAPGLGELREMLQAEAPPNAPGGLQALLLV
jgi:hypothetical protein